MTGKANMGTGRQKPDGLDDGHLLLVRDERGILLVAIGLPSDRARIVEDVQSSADIDDGADASQGNVLQCDDLIVEVGDETATSLGHEKEANNLDACNTDNALLYAHQQNWWALQVQDQRAPTPSSKG